MKYILLLTFKIKILSHSNIFYLKIEIYFIFNNIHD